MRPINSLLGLAAGASLLAACAAPQPTATAPPVAEPARSAAATSAPAAAGAPTPTTAAPSVPTKPVVPTPTAASTAPAPPTQPAPAGVRTFAVVPDQSEVKLTVREQLADRNVQNDAVLATRDIKGQIVVDRQGKLVAEGSKFTVALDSLKSDRGMRDNFIRQNTLQTSRFPNAEFQPTDLRLTGPAPTSAGPVKGQLVGNMTVRGVERPVTFELDGQLDGQTIKGSATTSFKITDFGMTLPRVPVVASIEDLAQLLITFTASAA